MNIIKSAGFHNIQIKKTKTVELSDELLKKGLTIDQLGDFRERETGIFSITVVGHKQED